MAHERREEKRGGGTELSMRAIHRQSSAVTLRATVPLCRQSRDGRRTNQLSTCLVLRSPLTLRCNRTSEASLTGGLQCGGFPVLSSVIGGCCIYLFNTFIGRDVIDWSLGTASPENLKLRCCPVCFLDQFSIQQNT